MAPERGATLRSRALELTRYNPGVSTARTVPFVSLEEFLEMEPPEGVRIEWCAGLVYSMSGGTPTHSSLCARSIIALSAVAGPECTVFDANADIWIEAAQFYGRADASLVCGALHTHVVKRNDKTLGEATTNPVVIVEVLSPSTATRDQGEKFAAYKQIASIEEYVLITQDERRVEIRRRHERGWSTEIVTGSGSFMLRGKSTHLDALYGGV